MQPLVILGAGTFALEVTDLVEDLGGFEIVGYAVNQDGPVAVDKELMLTWSELLRLAHKALIIGAMVSVNRVGFINQVLALGFRSATLIHPSASVSKKSTVVPGAIVSRLVSVGCHSVIGSHTIINRSASIGHHSFIGPFSTIGPGVDIAGQVHVEAGVMVGIGARVLERLTIGHDAKVGAGSVVLSSVKAGARVLGNPAVEH